MTQAQVDPRQSPPNSEPCTSQVFRYVLARNEQTIAVSFLKKTVDGIVLNMKPYNKYENVYEECMSLIEISDGFVGNSCFCNTNVFVSQKYTSNPGSYHPPYLG